MRYLLVALGVMVVGCGPDLSTLDTIEMDKDKLRATVHDASETLPGTGMALRITNALKLPTGADEEPTICHLMMHLCREPAEAPPGDGEPREPGELREPGEPGEPGEPLGPMCVPLGVVNAGRTVLFHVRAVDVPKLPEKEQHKMHLAALSSCQATYSLWPVMPDFDVVKNLDLERHDEAVVLNAITWGGYKSQKVGF